MYWAREAFGVDRAERALGLAKSKLAAKERFLFHAEVDQAEFRAADAKHQRSCRRADDAFEDGAHGARAPRGNAARDAAGAANGASPNASSPRGERHDRELQERDAASDLFSRARAHDADSKL
jgi:hypothetical protein